MEKERFMVIDNQKGVVIPLQSEKTVSISVIKESENDTKDIELEDKVNRIHILIKALVKQSIKDTIKEYSLQLTEELKEYEKNEMKRWDRLEEADIKRWKSIECAEEKRWEKLQEYSEKYWEKIQKTDEQHWKQMEQHFKILDQSIREKQEDGKRKKHSIF